MFKFFFFNKNIIWSNPNYISTVMYFLITWFREPIMQIAKITIIKKYRRSFGDQAHVFIWDLFLTQNIIRMLFLFIISSFRIPPSSWSWPCRWARRCRRRCWRSRRRRRRASSNGIRNCRQECRQLSVQQSCPRKSSMTTYL